MNVDRLLDEQMMREVLINTFQLHVAAVCFFEERFDVSYKETESVLNV